MPNEVDTYAVQKKSVQKKTKFLFIFIYLFALAIV